MLTLERGRRWQSRWYILPTYKSGWLGEGVLTLVKHLMWVSESKVMTRQTVSRASVTLTLTLTLALAGNLMWVVIGLRWKIKALRNRLRRDWDIAKSFKTGSVKTNVWDCCWQDSIKMTMINVWDCCYQSGTGTVKMQLKCHRLRAGRVLKCLWQTSEAGTAVTQLKWLKLLPRRCS